MLPFMRPKKQDSVVTMKMDTEGKTEPMGEEGENHALMSAAEDLIRAVHAKDAQGVADAMQAGHDICSMGYCEGGDVE